MQNELIAAIGKMEKRKATAAAAAAKEEKLEKVRGTTVCLCVCVE